MIVEPIYQCKSCKSIWNKKDLGYRYSETGKTPYCPFCQEDSPEKLKVIKEIK